MCDGIKTTFFDLPSGTDVAVQTSLKDEVALGW